MIMTMLYLVLPIRTLVNQWSDSIDKDDRETYEKHCTRFVTDYSRSNPMTQKQANIDYLELLIKKGEMGQE